MEYGSLDAEQFRRRLMEHTEAELIKLGSYTEVVGKVF